MASAAEGSVPNQSAPTPTTHIEIFGAIAACLSGLAAVFNNSFRYLAYALAATNGVLLLVVAVMRINAGLKHKKHRIPLVALIAITCVVAIGLSGWSLAHPAKPIPAVPTAQQPPKPTEQVSRPTVYNSQTSGIGSQIINGDNNTVTSGNTHEQKKKERK